MSATTPPQTSTTTAPRRCASTADVLLDAYLDYPERFVRKIPAPPELPTAAWINPPPPPDTKEENQFRSNGTEGPPRQRTATSDNVAGHNESQIVLSQNG